MSEDKTQAATETVSESPATETTQDSSNEQYIAESKKYRKRAQDAEARLIDYEKKLADIETKALKKKEDQTEYVNRLESDVSKYKEKADLHDVYIEQRKNNIIEQHPEEDRERLSKFSLKDLEFYNNKINNNNNKNNAPEVVGTARKEAPLKPIDWSDKQSMKENWGQILNQYKKQPQK